MNDPRPVQFQRIKVKLVRFLQINVYHDFFSTLYEVSCKMISHDESLNVATRRLKNRLNNVEKKMSLCPRMRLMSARVIATLQNHGTNNENKKMKNNNNFVHLNRIAMSEFFPFIRHIRLMFSKKSAMTRKSDTSV